MKKRLENPSAKISKRIRKKKKRIKKTKPLRTFKFYVFPFKVRNSFVESNILTLFPRNLTLGIEEFLGQKNTMRETSRLSSPRLVSVLTAFPSLPPLPSRPSIFQSSCRIHFQRSSFPPPPPSLRLLSSFFCPSQRDIDLSVIFGRRIVISWKSPNERSRWLSKRVVNYAHAREFTGGQRAHAAISYWMSLMRGVGYVK